MHARVRRTPLLVAIAIGCSTYDDGLLQEGPSSAGTAGGDGAGSGGEMNTAGAASEGGAAGSAGAEGGGAEGGGAAQGGTGGSAGTSTQGGSAGSSNAPTLELIDDFEDGTFFVAPNSGRGGTWYLFNDGSSGSQGPTEFVSVPMPQSDMNERPDSEHALNMDATGYDESGVGGDFVFGKNQYDASGYAGVQFWAKVGPNAVDEVQIRFPDLQTLQKGMQCSTAADAGTSACGDHYGKSVTLTTSWQEYTVMFDELTHAGTGNPGPGGALDQAHVYGVEFVFGSGTVDFWLDDLNFILD